MSSTDHYETLRIRFDNEICFVQIYRPQANNTINDQLILDLTSLLSSCEDTVKIIVLEGLPEVFCFGADFKEIHDASLNESLSSTQNPEALYELWLKISNGPFLSIAHVRGKTNAGGIGFVAACDIVLCEEKAVFSLSELLFGLIPACVLPFLIRRVGLSKANYMTLMTQPVSSAQALKWGLVDDVEENSTNLLRKKLLRLRRLNKASIARYKRYINNLDEQLQQSKSKALAVNVEVFSDPDNLDKISRYVKTGQFPWE